MQRSDALDTMWREYKRTASVVLRNQLVEAYLPLVDYLSKRIAERLPRCIGVDEVRSAGALGLLDAVEGFDLTRGIKFETYCSIRVRGSILDELRSRDWVPRLVRSRAQKFAVAVRRLAGELGRRPTPVEIMGSLKIGPEEYDDIKNDLARLAIRSLDDTDEGDEDGHAGTRSKALADYRQPDPAEMLTARERSDIVLHELDETKRQIMTLYYFGSLTMKEIGRRLGLSESRICQIHGEAVKFLRETLAARTEEFAA